MVGQASGAQIGFQVLCVWFFPYPRGARAFRVADGVGQAVDGLLAMLDGSVF